MKELKPCPFCGGEAKLTKGITYLDNYVTCCECFSRTKTYNTKELAIKSWNKRNAWIPCKERLPKNMETVIFTTEDGKVECGWYDEKKNWCVNDSYFPGAFTFIAWQPLPKPYKEGEENVD